MELDANSPEIQELLKAEIEKNVGGLKANRDALLAEKKAAQEQLEAYKTQWDGLDSGKVRELMGHLESSEDAKLIAAGKVDEVLEKRTGALRADFEKRLTAAQEREEREQKQNQDLMSSIKKLKLEGEIREAASKLGVVPSAVADVLSRATGVFSLEESGQFIAKDSDGTTKLGKDGKTALQPSEWLESMRDNAGHWFPQQQGGGATGGGRNAGAYTLTRDQARDPAIYKEAKAAAARNGQPLQIVSN